MDYGREKNNLVQQPCMSHAYFCCGWSGLKHMGHYDTFIVAAPPRVIITIEKVTHSSILYANEGSTMLKDGGIREAGG